MTSSLRGVALAVCLLTAVLLACGQSEVETKLEVCEEEVDKTCKSPKDTFSVGLKEVSAVYVGERVGGSADVVVKWYAEKVEGQEPHTMLRETKTQLVGAGKTVEIARTLEQPDGFKKGEYLVEVWFGTERARSKKFEVK